jgi:GR25 family glycosyltransferase involved in LPS biosynthesis
MQFFKHAIYINLDERLDRKDQIEKEWKNIGSMYPVCPLERMSGKKEEDGFGELGCFKSHIVCIEKAIREKWNHILILEDDVQFLRPHVLNQSLETLFEKIGINEKIGKNKKKWDVLMLAGNNLWPYDELRDDGGQVYALRVSRCLTTTAYCVAGHYLETLLQHMREGIQKLQETRRSDLYAIDVLYTELQKQDDWFLLTPCTVIQRAGYSDIQKKHTDFRSYMLNYRKTI